MLAPAATCRRIAGGRCLSLLGASAPNKPGAQTGVVALGGAVGTAMPNWWQSDRRKTPDGGRGGSAVLRGHQRSSFAARRSRQRHHVQTAARGRRLRSGLRRSARGDDPNAMSGGPERDAVMTDDNRDEHDDFWYRGSAHAPPRDRLWRIGRRARRHHAGAGAVAGGLRPEPSPTRSASLQPLSGPAAPGGKTALVGLQMAVDRINKAGGINGRPVEIIVADDESKPDVGRRKTEKLWSRRTRSTPTSAASCPTSASPACRCSRRTRSST